ncbi:MAG: SDR family oxidoreductase [Candidatus Omnitrophica bacterium]|nr:SDR family oxidoreductase [Candidatus Omnitrophota bacterium]
MNICITGAAGHIGSALIRNISLPSVDKVHLVDNLMTQRYASLFNLPEGVNYVFHEIDVMSDQMREVIGDCDVLIHLAAVTDAQASFHQVELVEKVNKLGLEHVAKICAQEQCALLFPSSTSVYGVSQGIVDENCSEAALKPQSPYAESKLYGEKLLKTLSKEEGLRFVTFRLGTIFGYSIGMRFHTAVNKFIWQASQGKEITVWQTALNQKRPYCDLNDCVQAIQYVLKEDIFDGEIYNILTTNLTVAQVIEAIKKYVPHLAVKFVDSVLMNQLSYDVCTKKSLARGFRYTGQLDQRVRETIEQLRNLNPSTVGIRL